MQILPLQNPQEGWGYTTGIPHKKNKRLHRTKHVMTNSKENLNTCILKQVWTQYFAAHDNVLDQLYFEQLSGTLLDSFSK